VKNMGVYDEIVFKCPECGELMFAQSKSGECILSQYDNTMVPLDVALDANRHAPHECYCCGEKWVFDLSEISIPLKEYVPHEKE
jgi:hypothetical protein